MIHLGSRHGRPPVLGPGRGRRAPRRTWVARALVAGGLVAAVMGSAAPAMANSASPSSSPLTPGSVVLNANGTVTVTATGTWLWPFGRETDTTQGLEATVRHPCDNRTGVGWGVVWSDPADPGFTVTYHTNARTPPLTLTVQVGSRGNTAINGDDQVLYNATNPCGTFVQTNIPAPGDGYDTGIWSDTHTYTSISDLPKEICVITYDLGLAHPPGKHRISFGNNDNSIQWGLYENGYWDTATMGKNCSSLPAPVAAPPTTTQAPPVVTPVSHTVTTAAPVTKPGGNLAFTGFGGSGRLMAVLGGLFVLVGVLLYFGYRRKSEVRRLAEWLVEWTSWLIGW